MYPGWQQMQPAFIQPQFHMVPMQPQPGWHMQPGPPNMMPLMGGIPHQASPNMVPLPPGDENPPLPPEPPPPEEVFLIFYINSSGFTVYRLNMSSNELHSTSKPIEHCI